MTNQSEGILQRDGNTNGWCWNHPELGEFHFEEMGGRFGDWEREGNENVPFELVFHLNGSYRQIPGYNASTTRPPTPSNDLIEQAIRLRRILLDASQNTEMCSKVAKALWDDWHGHNQSGMWWSDSLDEVKEAWEECPEEFPKGADDLTKLVKLKGLRIFDNGSIAEGFGFTCKYWIDCSITEFEPEHGVGVEFSQDDKVEGLNYGFTAL